MIFCVVCGIYCHMDPERKPPVYRFKVRHGLTYRQTAEKLGIELLVSGPSGFEKLNGHSVKPEPVPNGIFLIEFGDGSAINSKLNEFDLSKVRARIEASGANAAEIVYESRTFMTTDKTPREEHYSVIQGQLYLISKS